MKPIGKVIGTIRPVSEKKIQEVFPFNADPAVINDPLFALHIFSPGNPTVEELAFGDIDKTGFGEMSDQGIRVKHPLVRMKILQHRIESIEKICLRGISARIASLRQNLSAGLTSPGAGEGACRSRSVNSPKPTNEDRGRQSEPLLPPSGPEGIPGVGFSPRRETDAPSDGRHKRR